jgi:hypothetical protein
MGTLAFGGIMRAENYRHYAAECLELAKHMNDTGCGTAMRTIAIAWMNLAEQAEKNVLAAQRQASNEAAD